MRLLYVFPHTRYQRTTGRGQIAIYLTLVIAIALVLTMVMVNIGKISMSRTNTSNASDAAALAAASMLASGDNVIKDLSRVMFIIYTVWMATQLARWLIAPYDYLWTAIFAQVSFTILQMNFYYNIADGSGAKQVGKQAAEAADRQARILAFENANIDDPHSEDVRAFFRKMADDPGYRPPDYSWRDQPDQEENTVKVNINGISTLHPIIIPGPVIFGACFPPPNCYKPGPDVPVADIVEAVAPPDAAALASLLGSITASIGENTSTCMCCWPPYDECIPQIPPIMTLGMGVPMFMIVPNDSGRVTVTTTRIEPDANLRLWQMRYRNPNGLEEGISSRATASYGGGSMPVGSSYDVRMENVQ